MSAVSILRGGKPNKLAHAANRADGPWFAAFPERNYHVRRPMPMERQQALCMHGQASAGQEWFVAARRAGVGIVERRFCLISAGASPDFDEATAQWLFDGALIAGAAPQRDLEQQPEGAA